MDENVGVVRDLPPIRGLPKLLTRKMGGMAEMKVLTSMIGKALLGAAVGALAFGSAQAQELKNINFMPANEKSCGTYPQFMIQAFGYLEKEGYKVTLLSTATTVNYVAFLQNGDADIAMLDAAQVLQAADNAIPIKVVYEAYQFAPEGIVVLDDSPIQSLADLKDVTVGMASDRDLTTTVIAMDSIGATLEGNNIRTVVVGDSGPIMAAALRDKTIDAFAGGSADRTSLEAQGVKFRNITPDAVSNNPGNSFAVWGPTMEEKRPLITAFLRAWAQAQHAGVIDTKAVIAACSTYVPEQFEDMGIGTRMINYQAYTLELRRTVHYGELQTDVWKSIQPGQIKAGVLQKEVDPAVFLETSFQEGLRDITTQEVLDGINKWKEANPDKVLN
jgi:NitT/TauT family transport system substrate-binding protein